MLAACSSKGGIPGEVPPTPEPAPVALGPDVNAHGSDPAWTLTLRHGTQMVLSRPGQPDLAATAPGGVVLAEQASWTGPLPDGRTIKLILYQSNCSDGPDGAAFPLSAEVDLPGETPMGGCAQPLGKAAKR